MKYVVRILYKDEWSSVICYRENNHYYEDSTGLLIENEWIHRVEEC